MSLDPRFGRMTAMWTTEARIVERDRIEPLDGDEANEPLDGAASNRFRATDFAPRLVLELPAPAAPGWYEIAVTIEASHDLQVRLLPGFDDRIDRARSTVLKPSGPIFRGTFRAPAPFRRFGLEPGRLPGDLVLRDVELRRMGPAAVLAMALAGARRAARRGPGPLLGFLRDALGTVLRPARFETFQPAAALAEPAEDDPDARYRRWIERYEVAPSPRRPDAIPADIALVVPLDPDDGAASLATLASLDLQSRAAAELLLVPAGPLPAAVAEAAERLRATGAVAAVLVAAAPPGTPRGTAVEAALSVGAAPHLVVLPPGLLARPRLVEAFAAAVEADPELVLAHGDEDALGPAGDRRAPRFKPTWSPTLLEHRNYVGAPLLVARSAWRAVAGRAADYPGAEDHDLALRLTETGRAVPVRLPEVLASRTEAAPVSGWSRVDPATTAASARRAVAGHLARSGRAGTVEILSADPARLRVRRPLPDPAPLVTVIVPTRDRPDLIGPCLDGLLAGTRYPALDILVVDNGSVDPAVQALLTGLESAGRIRVRRDPRPFDFAALNNAAAAEARGSLLCLLNDDVTPLDPDWLAEMVPLALEPGVGPVGAKLIHPTGMIQHAGILLGMHGATGHRDAGLPADAPGPDGRLLSVHEVAAVTGACLLVSRDLWDALGGLDPALPIAFNDVDFCLRARAAGRRTLFTGFARLCHAESASRGRDTDPERRARYERESAFFRTRWSDLVLDDPTVSPNLDRTEGAARPRA